MLGNCDRRTGTKYHDEAKSDQQNGRQQQEKVGAASFILFQFINDPLCAVFIGMTGLLSFGFQL